MKRLLPFPLLSAALAAAWLALAGEFSFAQGLLAAALAAIIPLVVSRFLDYLPRIASPGAAVRLTLLVTWDIVLANVAVSRLVLGPVSRLRPAFIEVPLALKHPQSIALLASIVTMTPGTVSADLSPCGRMLLVHALDCGNPERMIRDIKHRYEQPLLEIFTC
ncbi:MAG: Na+/H+ antiporter subunit E [Betaproteobacteria bacterium]